MEEKLRMLREAIDMIDWNDVAEDVNKPTVNEELAYAIFGDDLSIELPVFEIRDIFLFEL